MTNILLSATKTTLESTFLGLESKWWTVIISALSCLASWFIVWYNFKFQRQIAKENKRKDYNKYFDNIKQTLYNICDISSHFVDVLNYRFQVLKTFNWLDAYKEDIENCSNLRDKLYSEVEELESLFPGFKESCKMKNVIDYVDSMKYHLICIQSISDYISKEKNIKEDTEKGNFDDFIEYVSINYTNYESLKRGDINRGIFVDILIDILKDANISAEEEARSLSAINILARKDPKYEDVKIIVTTRHDFMKAEKINSLINKFIIGI